VVTHGEPHPGNVIRTSTGLVLVDWDTTRLAPPERDLWHVLARLDPEDAPDLTALYAECTGRHLQPALLERHGLAWALADVAGFTEELRHTSTETADTATAWQALVGTLEELAARHTSPKDQPFLGQEVTTRSSPAGP
jgi:thiamine kinase-like enzyme